MNRVVARRLATTISGRRLKAWGRGARIVQGKGGVEAERELDLNSDQTLLL